MSLFYGLLGLITGALMRNHERRPTPWHSD